MPAQLGRDLAGKGDHPAPSARLRFGIEQDPVVHLHHDRATRTVHRSRSISQRRSAASSPKRRLANVASSSTPGTEPGGVEQLDQASDGGDRTLGRIFLARALDPAGVPADQPVVGRRGQDRMQQPVRLRYGHRPERPDRDRPSIQPFLAPAPDRRLTISPGSVPKNGSRCLRQQAPVQVSVRGLSTRSWIHCSAYSPKATLPRSGSIQSPRRISTSFRVGHTRPRLRANVSGAGRTFPSGPDSGPDTGPTAADGPGRNAARRHRQPSPGHHDLPAQQARTQ